jgi:hypothetical protein
MDAIFALVRERWLGLLLEAACCTFVASGALWAGAIRRPLAKGAALGCLITGMMPVIWVLLGPTWGKRVNLIALLTWFVAIRVGIGGGFEIEARRRQTAPSSSG